MTQPTTKKLTAAQRRELEAKGVKTKGLYVCRYPDAPVGAERKAVAAAHARMRERMHELSRKKKELIKQFLENDPEAREVVKELKEVSQRFEVVRGRLFRHRVEVCRPGQLGIHIIGSGDTFTDAAEGIK